MFNLTNEQRLNLQTKLKSDREKILKGTKSFSLDKDQCLKYFKIVNDTFHSPCCYVKYISGDKAFVEAIFYGSGMFSHPKREGFVPLSEIEAKPSLLLVFATCLINLFKRPSHIFHGKKQQIWTFTSIKDKGEHWISTHTVSCKKCNCSYEKKWLHTKKIALTDNITFGYTYQEVIEKCESYNAYNNGDILPKKK